MKKTSFGINSVGVKKLNQNNIQENRHQRRREKEVQRL
jgi:hypothetical protein